jgi:chromosome partitioning protein
MSSDNLRKIKEVSGWINNCGDYLEDLQTFANQQVMPRRYKGQELVEAVYVSSPTTIYTAEAEGRIPKGERDERGRRLGATLADVLKMQEYFKTSPRRKDDEEPQVISFTNFKGGCYKSTTSVYAGSYYASLGYRVLLVDLDPQASLTLTSGLFPDIDSSYALSMAPFIAEDSDFLPEDIRKVVRNTYLPNMDIIPSCLELASIEFELSNEIIEARTTNNHNQIASVFFRVKDALAHLKYDYDLVILDGTPSLGLLPLNIILASDTVVVPVPTEPVDFASTRSFCKLYLQQAEILNKTFGEVIPLPEMYILPTRYSPLENNATVSSQEILTAIRDIFNTKCLSTVVRKHESVVSNLSFFRRTIFDVNAGDCNVSRDARKKAMANFSAVFDEILEKIVFPKWKSKRAQLEDKGIIR